MLVRSSRLFSVFVVSGVVLIGGTAWLSAQRLSAPSASATDEGPTAVDLASPGVARGNRRAAREVARVPDAPAVTAGDRAAAVSAPSGADGQPGARPQAADAPGPANAPVTEPDEADPPPHGARPKDAPRVNPTSGELMWSARDVIPDGGRPDEPLCGGKACRPGQFCCGPPECGRCAYPMAGPRCPSVCPERTNN